MRRPAVTAGLAVLMLLAGCAHSTTPRRQPSAARSLQRRADLAPCPTATGQRAGQLPDVRLPCLSGGPSVRLAHLTGVPMIVNIWASWCRPCYQEMPVIARVHARAGTRLRVLGVDTSDARDGALHAAIDTGVHYPSLFDPHRRVAAGLGRDTQPTTVFVRADGSIAYVRIGPVHDAAQLEELVRRYLGVRL